MIFFLALLIFQDTEVFRHKNRCLFFPQKKPCFDVFDCSFVIRFELNILSKKMTSEAFSEGHLTPDVSFISVLRDGCLITC